MSLNPLLFTSSYADGGDATKFRPSVWNNVTSLLSEVFDGASGGRRLGLGISPFSNAGLAVKNSNGPGVILQSGDVAESDNNAPLFVRRGLNGDVTTMIGAFGTIYTNTSIVINGGVSRLGTINVSGAFVPQSGYATGTGLLPMLDIYSDVAGPCIGTRVSSVPGWNYQTLDEGGNFVFSIEHDGTLQWGASAAGPTGTQSHAAMDVGLSRDGIDILALKRGTHNCQFRVYGNGTNYLRFSHDGTNGQIGGAQAGNVSLGKLLNWTIDAAGPLYPGTHNTYDIGNTPSSLAVRNLFVAGAITTGVKAGTAVDGDVSNPADGMIRLDSSANKIWVRLGGTWKFVALT